MVHAAPVPLVREASGRLAPTRASDVRARVPGVLQKRLYKEGSLVTEGQPLVLIDSAPYRAQLAAATANSGTGRSISHQCQGDRQSQSRAVEAATRVAHAARRLRSARTFHRRPGLRGACAGADRAHQSELRHGHLADRRPRRAHARARRRAGRPGRSHAANYRRTGRSDFRVLRSAGVRFRTAAACAGRWQRQYRGGQSCRLQLVRPDGTFYEEKGTLDFSDYA